MKEQFISLLRVSLGTAQQLDRSLTAEEWEKLFVLAQEQAVAGVCFSGIETLPQEQRPSQGVILQWYALTQQIEHQNMLLNKKSIEILRHFDANGFKGCILKGQGNAQMYPKPERRQPGDIDIWLMPKEMSEIDFGKNRKIIIKYVLGKYPNQIVQLHHVDFPPVGGVEVEVHFFPIYLKNPFHHHRLLTFFKKHAIEQFENSVKTDTGEELRMPTTEFNLVFQLVHVYLHFLFQGIGMRQIIDYFYLLRSAKEKLSIENEELTNVLKSLRMMKFVRAMMWIQKEILGLDEKYLFADCDEKEGKRLLSEIMVMGNFGKYDTKYWKHRSSGFVYGLQKMRRQLNFLLSYPQEIVWDPYFRAKLFYAMHSLH